MNIFNNFFVTRNKLREQFLKIEEELQAVSLHSQRVEEQLKKEAWHIHYLQKDYKKRALSIHEKIQRDIKYREKFKEEYRDRIFSPKDFTEVLQYKTVAYDNGKPCNKKYAFPVLQRGAMKHLISDDFKIFNMSSTGYHEINLKKAKAYTGASEYSFIEHIEMIKEGKAEGFIVK